MQTIGIVLNVDLNQVEAFEHGFRDEHDNDPRFDAWNKRADAYQIDEPFVFGGDTVVSQGP